MIGALRGTVEGRIRDSIVLMVQGVGYRVHTTVETLTTLSEGTEITLWTYLAVRENAQDLYGFLNKDDLQLFELLLTVSSVGPKSALAVINAVDSRTLKNAIARGDAALLAAAHGIGKKTAEKIVLELREKVGAEDDSMQTGNGEGDVLAALMALGYSQKEAREAARSIPESAQTTEEKIREAIKIASRA